MPAEVRLFLEDVRSWGIAVKGRVWTALRGRRDSAVAGRVPCGLSYKHDAPDVTGSMSAGRLNGGACGNRMMGSGGKGVDR